MPYINGIARPSEQLQAILTGAMPWNDAPAPIQSWARRFVHEAAVQIAAQPDKAARQRMLSKIPGDAGARVEAEVLRLWNAKARP